MKSFSSLSPFPFRSPFLHYDPLCKLLNDSFLADPLPKLLIPYPMVASINPSHLPLPWSLPQARSSPPTHRATTPRHPIHYPVKVYIHRITSNPQLPRRGRNQESIAER